MTLVLLQKQTSLLNVLAGRVCSNKRVAVSAKVCLGSELVDPITVRKHIAFVPQNDTLFCSATPRESIRFSARLRLPAQVTAEQIEALTDHMLKELGLLDCADTIVGDGETMAGISGGERKRTAVGVELVTKPDLVFLDEPTSGLDSYSALQLTAVLRKVAQSGASVLFTIHQPASDIFQQFDRLILLNKGRVMYQGSVQNVPGYFGDRGRPLPPNYNPADWILVRLQMYFHLCQISVSSELTKMLYYFLKNWRNFRLLHNRPVLKILKNRDSFQTMNAILCTAEWRRGLRALPLPTEQG